MTNSIRAQRIPLFLGVALLTSIAFAACSRPSPPEREPASQATPATSSVVATWAGGTITQNELTLSMGDSLRDLDAEYARRRHQLERAAATELLEDKLIREAAAERKKTVPELKAEVLSPVTVSEAEVRAVYDQAVASEGVPFKEAKPLIESELRAQREQAALDAFVATLYEKRNARVTLPTPTVAMADIDIDGRPTRGPEKARATIIVFEDFECPYCKDIRADVDALVAAFPNDLRVVFMHYPLSFHEVGKAAAVAAECAHQQGRFWAMHDQLFDHQDELRNSKNAMSSLARAAGLDEARFLSCVSAPATQEQVDDDVDQGDEAGVEGTPSVIVNGVLSDGLPSIEELRRTLMTTAP